MTFIINLLSNQLECFSWNICEFLFNEPGLLYQTSWRKFMLVEKMWTNRVLPSDMESSCRVLEVLCIVGANNICGALSSRVFKSTILWSTMSFIAFYEVTIILTDSSIDSWTWKAILWILPSLNLSDIGGHLWAIHLNIFPSIVSSFGTFRFSLSWAFFFGFPTFSFLLSNSFSFSLFFPRFSFESLKSSTGFLQFSGHYLMISLMSRWSIC